MKIAILGHFGIGKTLLNGQTVKSNNLADGLQKYTEIEIQKIDTHGWQSSPLRLLGLIRRAFKSCDAIIMLPAHNGVRVFAPILLHYKKRYKKKVFYDVIGGWLPEFLKDKPSLAKTLHAFDGIWVETSSMQDRLCKMGFQNVEVVRNFKSLHPLTEREIIYSEEYPLKLCTFSRVMEEKGIEIAVDTVKKVNHHLGYTAFSLDIYGQVDESQMRWFDDLKIRFPDYISYKGCVDSSASVEVLKSYFALLFPTRFYTEGIPGTIIDAYAAGVPVISAKWESFSDIINSQTGIGYGFDDTEEFEAILLNVANNPSSLSEKKVYCLSESEKYKAETVIKQITELLM